MNYYLTQYGEWIAVALALGIYGSYLALMAGEKWVARKLARLDRKRWLEQVRREDPELYEEMENLR
jgi:hypothetical protein